jgi:pSer/pThr/pTyr-binding forkhead associated (FHA) protein
MAQTRQSLEFDPAGGPVRVGRDPDAGVPLDSPSVSRVHFSLEPARNGWTLLETSSVGTEVNGRPLRNGDTSPIADGDRLRLGTFELHIAIDPPPPGPATSGPGTLEALIRDQDPRVGPPRVREMMGDETLAEYPLAEDGVTLRVGRGSDVEIRLVDPYRVTSALHAIIERSWAGSMVKSLGRNGVYVNGEKIDVMRPLADGDRLTFASPVPLEGSTHLVYQDEAGAHTAPIEPPPPSRTSPPTPSEPPDAGSQTGEADPVPESTAGLPRPSTADVPPEPEGKGDGDAKLGGESPLLVRIAIGVAALAVIAVIVVGFLLRWGRP